MNQTLIAGGFLLVLAGVFGPFYFGTDVRAFVLAMLIALVGMGLLIFGVLRWGAEEQAACEAKGGTLVRSVCIDRNAIIEVNR